MLCICKPTYIVSMELFRKSVKWGGLYFLPGVDPDYEWFRVWFIDAIKMQVTISGTDFHP